MVTMPLADSVLIFDLDGTLVDSAQDLSRTLNHILSQENLPPLPLDLTRHMVGHGAVAMMKKGFEAAGQDFPQGDDAERLRRAFVDHYRAHIANHTILFEGCREALEDFTSAGAILTICTNKHTELAVELIEALEVKGLFAEILGLDALPTHKPDPAPLMEIMSRTGRSRGVMVGDSYTDRDAARGAGIPCALATFGYGTLNEPLLGSERLFSHYANLPAIVREVMEQTRY